jgi:3-mercaptopyruvate sulfurtransferase SseA
MNSGFARVRPLLGGLEAWIEAGHPVERLRDSDAGAPSKTQTA